MSCRPPISRAHCWPRVTAKRGALPSKVKDGHRHDVYGACEFLFPDMKTRTFRLIGIMK